MQWGEKIVVCSAATCFAAAVVLRPGAVLPAAVLADYYLVGLFFSSSSSYFYFCCFKHWMRMNPTSWLGPWRVRSQVRVFKLCSHLNISHTYKERKAILCTPFFHTPLCTYSGVHLMVYLNGPHTGTSLIVTRPLSLHFAPIWMGWIVRLIVYSFWTVETYEPLIKGLGWSHEALPLHTSRPHPHVLIPWSHPNCALMWAPQRGSHTHLVIFI